MGMMGQACNRGWWDKFATGDDGTSLQWGMMGQACNRGWWDKACNRGYDGTGLQQGMMGQACNRGWRDKFATGDMIGQACNRGYDGTGLQQGMMGQACNRGWRDKLATGDMMGQACSSSLVSPAMKIIMAASYLTQSYTIHTLYEPIVLDGLPWYSAWCRHQPSFTVCPSLYIFKWHVPFGRQALHISDFPARVHLIVTIVPFSHTQLIRYWTCSETARLCSLFLFAHAGIWQLGWSWCQCTVYLNEDWSIHPWKVVWLLKYKHN